MTGASASVIGWAVAMSTAGLDKGAPRVKVPPSFDFRGHCRRKRRRRVKLVLPEDSSDNEDAETGHWKSKNKYREDEDEDMSRPWRRQKVDAFTRRISDFSEDKKRRMPANGNARNCSANYHAVSIDVVWKSCEGIPLKFLLKEEEPRTRRLARVKQRQGDPQAPRPSFKEKPPPRTAEKATQTTGHRNSPGDNPMTRVAVATHYQRSRRAGTGEHKYTPLTMTPKEILATEGANFPRPPPMRTPEEQRVGNGYCEYHRQKGHTTNECVQLRQLIDKLVKEGRLDHLVMAAKTKQTVSQKFSHGSGISFPTLTADNAVVEPLTIEINAAGHDIHRMYIDGGASADILYEHCFQRLRPEVKRALHNSLDEFYGDQITIAIQWHYWKTRNISDTRDSETARNQSDKLKGPRCTISDYPTGVPRSIQEHKLKIRQGYFPSKGKIERGKLQSALKEGHSGEINPTTVISKPGCVGRLQSGACLLGEHNISYRPCTAVKGQILVDFLIEKPETDAVLPQSEVKLQEPWILFTDGSSCVDGSGAGLILTNPEGMEFTYALRFEFTATNNEAEYEALIAGLRIAARMGVRNLEANVDSRLVANHVLGEYVAKEDNMIQYLDKTKSLIQGFDRFTIRQVPRGDNKKADALSKIASTSFAHLSKQVLVEILKNKSISEMEISTVIEEQDPTWMTPIIEFDNNGSSL
ncbi:reverse transcriptase domain-containing protein [Tanacetum coccineum]